jgi:hypothetical protein
MQQHLAGEIASFLQLMWIAPPANLVNVHGTPSFNYSAAAWRGRLRKFVELDVPAVPGCATRGLHCDSDQVALAALNLVAETLTASSCVEVQHTIRTWPFVTMSLDAPGGLELAGWDPVGATQCNGHMASLWSRCTLLTAVAAKGKTLTPLEERNALIQNPPPGWALPGLRTKTDDTHPRNTKHTAVLSRVCHVSCSTCCWLPQCAHVCWASAHRATTRNKRPTPAPAPSRRRRSCSSCASSP